MVKQRQVEEWTKSTIAGLEVTHIKSTPVESLTDFIRRNQGHLAAIPNRDESIAKVTLGKNGVRLISRIVSQVNSKGDKLEELFAHLVALRSSKVAGVETPVAFVKLPNNRAAIVTKVPASRTFKEFVTDNKIGLDAKFELAHDVMKRLAKIHAHGIRIGDATVKNLQVYSATVNGKSKNVPLILGFSKLSSGEYAAEHLAEFQKLSKQLNSELEAAYSLHTNLSVDKKTNIQRELQKTYETAFSKQKNALEKMYGRAPPGKLDVLKMTFTMD